MGSNLRRWWHDFFKCPIVNGRCTCGRNWVRISNPEPPDRVRYLSTLLAYKTVSEWLRARQDWEGGLEPLIELFEEEFLG